MRPVGQSCPLLVISARCIAGFLRYLKGGLLICVFALWLAALLALLAFIVVCLIVSWWRFPATSKPQESVPSIPYPLPTPPPWAQYCRSVGRCGRRGLWSV